MGSHPSYIHVFGSFILALPLAAAVQPNPLFSDHAVLQAGHAIPVWGTASEGEVVTVSLAGQKARAITKNGHWKVLLPARKAGGPFVLRMAGTNVVEAKDVLVGEVWLAGGQSNMERQLGPRPPQKPITGWEAAAASADMPSIREFHVDQARSLEEKPEAVGHWVVCTPQTATEFSAVGFFFARELWKQRRVSVGMIHSSWGGTPAEAWMSETALKARADYAPSMQELHEIQKDPAAAGTRYQAAWKAWYQAFDPGTKQNWADPSLTDGDWTPQNVPGNWEEAGLSNFDGVVWYRRSFEVPADWAGQETELHLGAIDDIDTTWINGRQIGTAEGWNTPRIYRIPAGTLQPGRNVIAVRIMDTGGGGGFSGGDGSMRLELAQSRQTPFVDFNGTWRRKVSTPLSGTGPIPMNPTQIFPGVLYNAMIAPLVPYGIRGVIWYQGEANVGRETQYRSLFPDLVADWRKRWGQGEFPFLFVQIAPFESMTPEIREAQLLALKATPNTAMAVTLDVGDANDIHPTQKQPVGERLALAARALAYGEKIEYSGPIFEGAEFSADAITLRFSHLGGGLVAPGGVLKGFTVLDAQGVAHPAKAEIQGDAVRVSTTGISNPKAVRYAWAHVPEGNLFNRAGLPASPFRTDFK